MHIALTAVAVALCVSAALAQQSGRLSGFDGDNSGNFGSNNNGGRNSNTNFGGGRVSGSRDSSLSSVGSGQMFNGAICPNIKDTPKCATGQSDTCTRDRDCGVGSICCSNSGSRCQKVCRQYPSTNSNSNNRNSMNGNSRNNQGFDTSNSNSRNRGSFVNTF